MEVTVLWKWASRFDRSIKRAETLEEYIQNCPFFNAPGNVSFDLADGVSTSYVLNIKGEVLDENGDPDYLLVIDNHGEEKRIASRWFVVECIYLRRDQYRILLRRDAIADYYDAVLDAPCIVDRGPLSPSDPLIYNDEEGTFNQIKEKEILLKDETETPWIVGYLSRDTSSLTVQATTESVVDYPELLDLPLTFTDPADPSKGATLDALSSDVDVSAVYQCDITNDPLGLPKRAAYLYSRGSSFGYVEDTLPAFAPPFALMDRKDGLTSATWGDSALAAAQIWNAKLSTRKRTVEGMVCQRLNIKDRDDLATVLAASGSVYYDSDAGKYYQLTVAQTSYSEVHEDLPNPGNDDLPALAYELMQSVREVAATDPSRYEAAANVGANTFAYKITKASLYIQLQEVAVAGTVSVTIPAGRRHLIDAPYDMFCMPFNQDNLALAHAIVAEPLGEGETKRIFDLQILPYCPRRDALLPDALDSFTEDVDYAKIMTVDEGDDPVETGQLMFFCMKSSDTFYIEASGLYVEDADNPGNAIKLNMKCSMYRLTSPNYSSTFEFSVARNGGRVDSFRVDFTYKPISPYIHVAPFFSGLYGSVNDDARGLICGGDYSVDMISDAWTEYQNANKNYQNIFNVRIKSMDDKRMYDRVGGAFAAAGSTIAAAVAGFKMGGPAGAAASGAAGAAGSLYGLATSEEKYQIDRQAQIDMFRYDIGNVVATPDTLTKVSAYNVNNKYFPMVEVFGSTDREKELFLNYLNEFNYRVGALTTIRSILAARWKDREYVKGRIVRLEAFGCDEHVATEIYEMVAEGVYFL